MIQIDAQIQQKPNGKSELNLNGAGAGIVTMEEKAIFDRLTLIIDKNRAFIFNGPRVEPTIQLKA